MSASGVTMMTVERDSTGRVLSSKPVSSRRSKGSRPKPPRGVQGESKLWNEVAIIVGDELKAKDEYQLKGELGRGGFGVAFKACNRRTGEPVVVKQVPLAPMRKEALDLLVGEVQ